MIIATMEPNTKTVSVDAPASPVDSNGGDTEHAAVLPSAAKGRKEVRSFILLGILLFFIGLGNIILGSIKSLEYSKELSSLSSSPLRDYHISPSRFGLIDLRKEDDGLMQADTLEARLNFYRFVRNGGYILSVIGLTIVLLGTYSLNQSFIRRLTKAYDERSSTEPD